MPSHGGGNKNRRASRAVGDMSEEEIRDQLEIKMGMLNNKSMFASTSTSPDPLETRLLESVKQLQARLATFSSVEHVTGQLNEVKMGGHDSGMSLGGLGRNGNGNGDGSQVGEEMVVDEPRSPVMSKMGKMPASTSLDLEEVAHAKDNQTITNQIQQPKGPFDQLSRMAQLAKMRAFLNHQPDESDEEDWDQDDQDDDDENDEDGYARAEGFEIDVNGEQATDGLEAEAEVEAEGMDMVMDLEDGSGNGSGMGKAVVLDVPWDQVIAIDVARTAGKGMDNGMLGVTPR